MLRTAQQGFLFFVFASACPTGCDSAPATCGYGWHSRKRKRWWLVGHGRLHGSIKYDGCRRCGKAPAVG